MKKFILVSLISIMLIGCSSNTSNYKKIGSAVNINDLELKVVSKKVEGVENNKEKVTIHVTIKNNNKENYYVTPTTFVLNDIENKLQYTTYEDKDNSATGNLQPGKELTGDITYTVKKKNKLVLTFAPYFFDKDVKYEQFEIQ